jgi:mono/diheme cytochrome c family protein
MISRVTSKCGPGQHCRPSCSPAAISGSIFFCSPCHGANGDGNGIIVQRGMPGPTSYHADRLRLADDQHFFDVITNGYGAMYSYASRVPPRDRWAIVAYIRALQLSRHASIDDVPSTERDKLLRTP